MTQKTTTIVTWNVNSIKARLEHVKGWLEDNQPDLLLIQELKGLDFPAAEFDAIGYHSQAVTQKAYNGVAILSKQPVTVVLNHLPGDESDEQARYLEIDYNNLRIINIGGDFNVIPADEDCHDPAAWRGDAAFRPETHAKWQALLNLGLYDAFRIVNHDAGQYSFWDYQRGAWQKDNGIRIDHFLLSPPVTDKLINCHIDKAPRGAEKASDHTPVILEIKN